MPIDECIERHTHRAYQMWINWLDEQYNVPSLTDWYLMQLTKVVATSYMRKKAPAVGAFKLKFDIGPPSEEDMKKRAERSMAAWGAILGSGKPQQLQKGPPNGH